MTYADRASLLVYGARCSWWDSIDKAAKTEPLAIDGEIQPGLPCCPHCASVLFEVGEQQWWEGVDRITGIDPRYRSFIEWVRGKCFPSADEARAEFDDVSRPGPKAVEG